MCRNAQGPNILSALWFLSVGSWQDVLQHSTVLYSFALCFVFSIHNGRPWHEEFGAHSVLYSLCWGKLLWFPASRFLLFVQGVPLLDFLFHFPFWKVTYVTAPRLLSIIIYHNLEMNSKYRLNIFQLSVNDNLEKTWDNFRYISLTDDRFLLSLRGTFKLCRKAALS